MPRRLKDYLRRCGQARSVRIRKRVQHDGLVSFHHTQRVCRTNNGASEDVGVKPGSRRRRAPSKRPAKHGSPLLNLPAELRNSIYRLVLLEQNPITVTRTLQTPGLTQTCQQIRRETIKPWIMENEFRFDILHCDTTLLTKWQCRVPRMNFDTAADEITIHTYIRPSTNWANVLNSCIMIWSDNGRVSHTLGRNREAAGAVICAAEKIAVQFRDRPWAECSRALASLRIAIGAFDSRWND